ncbi:MAG: DNA polymerase I [Gammaproteobacteria bacterium 28-57-27]|nr:MAG: DNA polymerase I [Gammaproteobacteria bacterium 28-57-27]
MSAVKPALLLVDGSSYLFRAFHALPPLTTFDGTPTGALHGVLAMIQKLVLEEKPSHVAVVFDAPGKTFRDELYAQYKAHRPSMPEELRVQIAPLHQAIAAMGLPLLIIEGVEADDVIATLTHQAQARGMPVLISTGDKDMAQLSAPGVTLIDTMKNTRLDPAGVEEKFGVPPERIVDYLALMGDTSDNVPGVKGCGPKTAVKWLQEYGSFDGVMAAAATMKGKAGENLREALAHLPLSRELVTVKTDVALPLALDALTPHAPDLPALIALAERYELQRHLKAWQAQHATHEQAKAVEPPPESLSEPSSANEIVPAASVQGGGCYQSVLDEAALADWLQRIAAAELTAFDTETTSLDPMQAEIVGISLSVQAGEAVYIPLAHSYPGAPEQLERDVVLQRLRPWLESAAHAKVGQNLKYDAHVLANHGITLRGIAHDTLLESYVLDAGQNRHDLDTLARRHLEHENISYELVAGKGAKQIPFAAVSVDIATDYAAEDADITLRLHQVLWPRLRAVPGLQAVYERIEIPLLPVLMRIERHGVQIDVPLLKRVSHELSMRMMTLEKQAHELAGGAFNLASPKQLQEILFERLGLPVVNKTPTGQPSTNEEVLEQLADQHELPRVILEHRMLAKLKSTYADKLPEAINPRTGRVHTMYQQAVASTGRLSSTEPNLQNIPARSEEGRRIRQAFTAPEGQVILSADYSQIELRIMAHLSADAGLLKAFAEGRDIHRATAAEVFGVALDAVTDLQRRAAKAINFGLIYGMSAFGLARQLSVPRAEAQAYVDLYFARYPGVRRYMEAARERARELGYAETLFGRRLLLPEIKARDVRRRQQAERIAINAPMQGTAADIIKRAMITIDAWLMAGNFPAKMVMQVHDELVFEVPLERADELAAEIKMRMASAADLAVPLVVDVGIGKNWDEAH